MNLLVISLCMNKVGVFCRSVPSGRVGNAKDAIFRSNEHFREAVGERESMDVQVIHPINLPKAQAMHYWCSWQSSARPVSGILYNSYSQQAS